MCKRKQCPNFDKCKCDNKDVNYNDYTMTTSPHHIRNKQIDIESTTFTTEDEDLYLINLGVTGIPDNKGRFNMLNITEKDGLSWELVALLEVAAEEAGYDSPESFMIDIAVKEAGKVLAKADKHKGKNNYVDDEEDFPQEEQLDLFGEQE